MSIASNIVTVTVTQPTYSVQFCAEGLEQGDQATIQVAGQGYVLQAGGCVTVSGLSGSVNWVAYTSNEGATPSPSSGTVSKATTIYITYNYPSRTYSPVQITNFTASSTSITQGSSVKFNVSASGGSGSYYFTLYVDNNPVGNTVGPSSSATISYTFNEAGTYSVYAAAVDASLGASYSATSSTITINVQAPPSTYTLTFTETGLPTSYVLYGNTIYVTWSVTINGQTQSAQAGQPIVFTGLSGTVNYTVQSPITVPVNRYHSEKYYANPSSGTATQGGTIPITYSTSSSSSSSSTTSSSSSSSSSSTTKHNVSNLSVCDSSIQNGDYAIVNNQAETGYSGTFTIIDASGMKNDAYVAGECSASVSAFIRSHPVGNGRYWTTP